MSSSSCGVCTAPLSALGGNLAACPSGDVFHESCIQKFVASRGQCCTCKQRCTQQQLVTLKLPHTQTAATTQHTKQAAASTPSTSSKTSASSPARSRRARSPPPSPPPSPTLPAEGSPLSLAQVEALIDSYQRTVESYDEHRKLMQVKMSDKLEDLVLAFTRVFNESKMAATAAAGSEQHESDDAVLHRHTLMSKLLACVHEAHLRNEEEGVDEMARVLRRLEGHPEYDEDRERVADVLFTMEEQMEEMDGKCYERAQPKRQQLADMDAAMRRVEREKNEWTTRERNVLGRRMRLQYSLEMASRKRERDEYEAPPSPERPAAAVPSQLMEVSQPAPPPSELIVAEASDDDDDDSSHQHNSPPLSATSSTSHSASKRRKLPAAPLIPPPQLTPEQFSSLSEIEKLQLPRITILTHCPTIESFLTHQLHLRTVKRRWPDNEWRKINTTYTGQRKRKGLKGRGKGRQVLPATEEEQHVWREVRKREIALLVDGKGDAGGEGVGVSGMGVGGGGEGGSGSGGMEDDEDEDERSEDEGNESHEKNEDSERSERSEEHQQLLGNGHPALEHAISMHA